MLVKLQLLKLIPKEMEEDRMRGMVFPKHNDSNATSHISHFFYYIFIPKT